VLALASDDAAFLAGYLRRLRNLDEWAAVRVQVRGRAVGAFGVVPPGVLGLVVVPLALPDAGTVVDDVDVVVSAGRLRDVLGDVAGTSGAAQLVRLRLPDPVDGPAVLDELPPRSGWTLEHTVMAGELSAAPHGARSVALPDGRWDELVGAAAGLALLTSPTASVRLASAPGWRRLQSPAGQVFARRQV
jgi:hypothetical protein